MTKETSAETADQNKYEVMLVLDPHLGNDETAKRIKELTDLIAEAGGSVWHEDDWGLRDLAYKIKGFKQGYYYVINFALDPSKIKKLTKHLRLEKAVVRSMIIKLDEDYQVKTLKEYEEEAAREKEEDKVKAEAEAKEAEAKRTRRAPVAPEKPKTVKKPEITEEEVEEEKPKKKVKTEKKEKKEKEEEVVEAVEEKKEEKKDKKKELDDLDKKLQSIINDPDIIL